MSAPESPLRLERLEQGYTRQLTELRSQIQGLKSVLGTLLSKVETTQSGSYRIVSSLPKRTVERGLRLLVGASDGVEE